MLAAVKLALRIINSAYDSEINSLIDAAKRDLSLSGVSRSEDISDPLIKQAIIFYCKANFGISNPESERYQKSYDTLKNHLSLAGDYNV